MNVLYILKLDFDWLLKTIVLPVFLYLMLSPGIATGRDCINQYPLPSTFHLLPSTFYPQPSTFNPQSSTFNPLPSTLPHAFKMSVCEIIYSQQNRTFEVKCYLFQDDLRETLYNDPINGLLSPDIVAPYIQKHLEITINAQKQNLQYASLQTKEDQVLVQFTISVLNMSKMTNLGIQNSLLLEKFNKQINVVYLYYPNEQHKRTKMLDSKKNHDVFEF